MCELRSCEIPILTNCVNERGLWVFHAPLCTTLHYYMGGLGTVLLIGHLLGLDPVWEQVLLYPTPKAYDRWSICTPTNAVVNGVNLRFSLI